MKHLISVVLVFLIACTFLISNTYAKWAYAFVVYNGNVYDLQGIVLQQQEKQVFSKRKPFVK